MIQSIASFISSFSHFYVSINANTFWNYSFCIKWKMRRIAKFLLTHFTKLLLTVRFVWDDNPKWESRCEVTLINNSAAIQTMRWRQSIEIQTHSIATEKKNQNLANLKYFDRIRFILFFITCQACDIYELFFLLCAHSRTHKTIKQNNKVNAGTTLSVGLSLFYLNRWLWNEWTNKQANNR